MKHTKNRVAALLLALAMVLSLMPMAFAADEYPDMPAEDDPSYAAVKSAIDNKIMTGENGELKLEGTILRSTVSKMVVTAFAAKGEADLSGYPDVDSEAWYAAWMAKANQMGIMTGTSGKMNPSNEVTLAEVAAMLVRALGLPLDKDAKLEGVADWAAPYIKALIDAGYLDAEDAAKAGEPMSRGAFAEVIYKVSGEGNYVSEGEITEDVDGNLVITGPVSLKGITVKGDIIIADGVDADSIVLDDVTVEGRLVVRGAKEVSLTNGTTAAATVVAKTADEVTLKADTTSDAGDIAVAGTNGKAADKVTLDMAEPKATVTVATDVAVQNAEGGEVTLAADVKLTVESGTVASVTVADGAKPAVEVAKDATIEKVTTNSDLTITGEGTVTEKAGSGTVTDAEGNEVAGSDEPAEVPTVSGTPEPADPNVPSNTTHTHSYTGTVSQFDATRHTIQCEGTPAQGTRGEDDYVAAVPCSAVTYEAHSFTTACKADGTVSETAEENVTFKCKCGLVKPADPSSVIGGTVTDGKEDCGDANHQWSVDTENAGAKELTCTQAGVVIEKCSECGKTRTTTTPATGHSLVEYQTTAPTCNTAGKRFFKCSNGCADLDGSTEEKSTVVEIPATGNHTWKQTSVTPATCAAEGHYTYTCTVCSTEDTSKTIAIDPNAHVWGDPAKDAAEGATTHTVTCTVDGCGGEDGEAATKTVACTYSIVVTEGDGAYLAPTCTVAGHKATQKCACGREQAGAAIPATGHRANSAWVKTDAAGHYHTCKTCNAQIEEEKVAHTGENSCTVCGWTKGGGSEQPTECPKASGHSALHAGQQCDGQGCNYTGTAAHDSDKCPGQACSCGVAGAKGTGSHNYQGGGEGQPGTCSKCNTACSDATHANCGCGYTAPAQQPG